MNPRIKEEWLKRLRSGAYKQGRTWLRRIKADGSAEHCCLGVLCEIWMEEASPDSHKEIDDKGAWGVRSVSDEIRYCTLPKEVVQWSGLEDEFGRLPSGTGLTDMNDKGQTFEQIADVIEKEL